MTNPRLRLAIAGGGTGGHVTPVLATLARLERNLAETGQTLELLWLGSHDGVERDAAARAGIPFIPIPTGKLRRYMSLATVGDLAQLPLGLIAAWRLLGLFNPDLLFSSGGYVSVPAVYAAWLRRIPCLTHEQTVTIGLANRLNARVADLVALSYTASAAWLPRHQLAPLDSLVTAGALAGSVHGLAARRHRATPDPDTGHAPSNWPSADNARAPIGRLGWPGRGPAPLVVTGNPVRAELQQGNVTRARDHFQLESAVPLIYVTGGARGAHAINEAVGAALPELLEVAAIVHQTGPPTANGDLPRLELLASRLARHLQARYRPRAFIGAELADLYAATTLVIGRAGAGTVAELAALGKPAVLIPLPGASADEQTRNADLLAEAGAAIKLPEAELTAVRLTTEIRELLGEPARLEAMSHAVRQFSVPDAAERLAALILALVG